MFDKGNIYQTLFEAFWVCPQADIFNKRWSYCLAFNLLTGPVDTLEGLLNRVIGYAQLYGTRIDLPMVQNVLKTRLPRRTNPRRPPSRASFQATTALPSRTLPENLARWPTKATDVMATLHIRKTETSQARQICLRHHQPALIRVLP